MCRRLRSDFHSTGIFSPRTHHIDQVTGRFSAIKFEPAEKSQPSALYQWKAYLLLGAFNAAIPFCLIAAAELSLDPSWAAILNAMTPLFTALVAYRWIHDPLTPRKLGGLVLGIVGVAVLVGWNAHQITQHMFLTVGLSLTAALFYGISGVFASQRFRGETPLTLAIGQQLAA